MIRTMTSFVLGAACLAALSFGATGCATILSGTSDNITIQSTPSSATYSVKTMKYENEVASGATPATINLSRKNEYKVTIKVSGYKEKIVPIYQEFNGWAICNLGGILGWGIDYLTGAIYKLAPQQINVTLETASIDGNTRLYGLIRRLDDQGQLRELRVPLEKDNSVAFK